MCLGQKSLLSIMKNWSYKIGIDAKDDSNNLAKTVSIVLYDPIKVEITKAEKTPKKVLRMAKRLKIQCQVDKYQNSC